MNAQAAQNKKKFDYEDIKRKLIAVGFDSKAVDDAVYYSKLGEHQKFWQASTPWDEEAGEKATVGKSLIMGAGWLVPGVYVGRHWNELGTTGKILNIALDVLSVAIPGSKAGLIGAREVAGT